MEINTQIAVPITWAGYTRHIDDEEVWACGACPAVRCCMSDGECARATPADFARGIFGDAAPLARGEEPEDRGGD